VEPAADQVAGSHAPLAAPGADRVPVTVLAGFLGSGKTTLLNRILEGGHGLRVAVFVNDFGAIDVDSRLVVHRNATVIALDNGCICCTIGADLVSQLTALIEGASCPEHVLVECSGVSDPGRLLVALRDPHLRRPARVDGVVTLVDSAAFDRLPPAALELARRQLASADVIVLNKADLVSRAELAGVRVRVAYPAARITEAAYADVPLELLLGVGGATAKAHPHRALDDHASAFATWTWTSSEPLAYDAVREALARLPAGVFRAKGFLYLAEAPGERVVAHVVGRRVEVRPLGPWNGTEPRTELVFVSLDPGVDRERVRALLARAEAAEAAPWSS
jgi:G3E family GTPase